MQVYTLPVFFLRKMIGAPRLIVLQEEINRVEVGEGILAENLGFIVPPGMKQLVLHVPIDGVQSSRKKTRWAIRRCTASIVEDIDQCNLLEVWERVE